MIRNFMIAAVAALGLSAPGADAAVQYDGTFNDGYIYGWFSGIAAGDGYTITGAGLTDFHITFDNRSGGPGQYYYATDSVSGFLFRDLGAGLGAISGTAYVTLWEAWCNIPGDRPCFPDEIPGQYVYRSMSFETDQVTFNRVDLSPAPVPVPGSLPLVAGGIAALAVLRRRRKAHI